MISPDLPGFDVVGALPRMAGNKKLFRKILIQFHDRYAQTGQEIRTLLTEGRNDDAKHLVHTIKGVAGNIGAEGVYQTAIALETAIGTGNYDEILNVFSENLQEAITVLSQTVAAPKE